MNSITRTHLENVQSDDHALQNKAILALLKATDKPVDWAYEVWGGLVADLRHKDNHVRAIAAHILCNLAKSDPMNRMRKDFPALLAVTKDERFVTARHCLQALWKVGAAGRAQQKMYMQGLETRFKECIRERNCTVLRYDINVSMRNLYDRVHDEQVKAKALQPNESERDLKYRKKSTSASGAAHNVLSQIPPSVASQPPRLPGI